MNAVHCRKRRFLGAYAWPAIWVGYFYGTRATVFIVAWIAAAQAVALLSMPTGVGNFDRWCDVVVSVVVVAGVVRALAHRNTRLVDELTADARVDPLTRLLNRRGLQERLAVEIARVVRGQTAVAAVALDIDHFKRINDTHGHAAGDRVLVWLAGVLADQTRGADIAARVGGEEFLVILPGAGATEAYALAERVRCAVQDGSRSVAPRALTLNRPTTS